MKTYGGTDVKLHVLLIFAQDGFKWSASCPGHFTPMETAPVPTEEQMHDPQGWCINFGRREESSLHWGLNHYFLSCTAHSQSL
jgi:hypothetical protein